MIPYGIGAPLLAGALLFAPPVWGAESWTMVPGDSTLTFQGTQMGASFTGHFQSFSADIAFSPEDLAGSTVDVTIDMLSTATGSADRDTQIPQRPWFAVDDHPTARFVTTAIAPGPDGGYLAQARLTIRDVTKPVEIPFTVVIDGSKAVAEGSMTIDRVDYHVGLGEWENGSAVGRDVTITFHVEATE
ncbi:MAG: YceI family protein [Rhodospirillum sp.]|nr:YceI family protein [Rhodospirillum sp.]MCF8487847.1 YceI family protein [Rhodospirillum sp.]